jgi:sodium/hydrogen exchanger 8
MSDSHLVAALHALFFVMIVCACLYVDFYIKSNKWYFLPESAGSMIVGFILGGIVVWGLSSTEEADVIKFDATLFFFILLPPIVFEAGYTLDRENFFSNIGSIFVYAVIGTCVSTIIVGYGLYYAAVAGVVPIDSNNALEALLFGSLISATDPVATLTLLGSPNIGAPKLLYSLVFGEAVLNDAVAIVLYKTFEGFLSVQFTNATIFYAFTKFLFVSVGSIILGFLIAIACSFVFKRATHLTKLPQMEISLILLFAYTSYFSAEVFGLSGIMSLFFCGIALAHYNYYNLSHQTQHATHLYFKSLAQICDTFVFAYLGITIGVSIDPSSGYTLTWSPALIGITLLLCFAGRGANVFPLTYFINKFRGAKPITGGMQVAMWFAGLRGAIAFALALQVPTVHGSEIVTTTLAVVIFTTFVCGGLTEPLLRKVELKNYVEPPSEIGPDGLPVDSPKGLARFWLIFDNTYMKRWFGGDINELYSLLPVSEEEKRGHGADDAHGHHVRAPQGLG